MTTITEARYVRASDLGRLSAAVTAALADGFALSGKVAKIDREYVQVMVKGPFTTMTAVQYAEAGDVGRLQSVIDTLVAQGYQPINGPFEDGRDVVQCMALDSGGAGTLEIDDGTVTVSEGGSNGAHITTFTFTNFPIALVDEPDLAQIGDSVEFYTFPPGTVSCWLHLFQDLTVTGYASLVDNWSGSISPKLNNFQQGGVILPAAAAKVSTIDYDGNANGIGGYVGNDETPATMKLYVLVQDNAAHGSGTVLVNGTLRILWTGIPAS